MIKLTAIGIVLLWVYGCNAGEIGNNTIPHSDSAGAVIKDTANKRSADTAITVFTKQLTWGNLSFTISQRENEITVQPRGLLIVNDMARHNVNGRLVNAEVSDITGDNWPEVMLYIQSVDIDKTGTVIGYSVNNGKSMSMITVPDIKNDPAIMKGYKGSDEFAMVENSFVRRFPLYDSAGNKTGKIRQLQYKLVNGEASKILKQYKVVEY